MLSMRRRSRCGLGVVSLFIIVLFGCARGQEDVVPIPHGDVWIHGVLSPADLSPVRRGSFLLSQEGHNVYYVESPTIHLRRFVGRELLFYGVVESNSDPMSLPVLVVRDVSWGDASSSSFSFSSFSSLSSSMSYSGSGIPCGGDGGVLCPEGEYCVVELLSSTFGHCRSIENRF